MTDVLVRALSMAGADVGYDQHEGAGDLIDIISKEVQSRQVFLFVLSKAAFASAWVRREYKWAYQLTDGNPHRTILSVTARPISEDEFTGDWLFLGGYLRIEQRGHQPWPQDIAIEQVLRQVLRTVGLTAARNRTSPAVVPIRVSAPPENMLSSRIRSEREYIFTDCSRAVAAVRTRTLRLPRTRRYE